MQLHLELVQPWRVQVPHLAIGQVEGEAVKVDPRACVGRLDVQAGQDSVPEILAEHRERKRDRLVQLVTALDFDPGLGAPLFQQRPNKDVMDVDRRARFDEHILVDAHAGRAMMPAHLRVVPARAGGRVDLVALAEIVAPIQLVPRVVAEHDGVVLDHDEQRVLALAGCGREFELERREESLVRAQARAIDEDARLVVHSFETHKQGSTHAVIDLRASPGPAQRSSGNTPSPCRSGRRNAAGRRAAIHLRHSTRAKSRPRRPRSATASQTT